MGSSSCCTGGKSWSRLSNRSDVWYAQRAQFRYIFIKRFDIWIVRKNMMSAFHPLRSHARLDHWSQLIGRWQKVWRSLNQPILRPDANLRFSCRVKVLLTTVINKNLASATFCHSKYRATICSKEAGGERHFKVKYTLTETDTADDPRLARGDVAWWELYLSEPWAVYDSQKKCRSENQYSSSNT